MTTNSSVSIIIPTFNRADIIHETIGSIQEQTHKDWECIIVDDNSNDNTREVIESLIEKDSRFQYFFGPDHKVSGANACRNFGLTKSIGEFIIWFDSDDLMVETHIEYKLSAFVSNNVDFVIAKAQNFNDGIFFKPYELFDKSVAVNADNYVLRKVHWYTFDVCIRRKIANLINYKESLFAWQDYYYFAKLLTQTTNYHVVDKVLTLRRVGHDSIQFNLLNQQSRKSMAMIEVKIAIIDDLSTSLANETIRELFFGIMNHMYDSCRHITLNKTLDYLKWLFVKVNKESFLLLITSLTAVLISNRGYALLARAKQNLSLNIK